MMIVECVKFHPDKIKRENELSFYTEYRLDFYPEWQQIDFSLFPQSSILTCKGDMLCPALVEKMFLSNALVDIDFCELDKYHDLVEANRLLLSMHLPAFNEARIREFLDHPQPACAHKLIIEANTFDEIVDTASILYGYPNRKVVFNVSGKWALFQRSLFNKFCSYGLYFAANEALFEGQPSKKEILLLMQHYTKPDPAIILIIGDHRVNRSGSLTIGNKILAAEQRAWSYIPVPASDLQEAAQVIIYLKSAIRIAGIAVTNPFKAMISEYLKLGTGAVNTIQYSSHRHDRNFYNEQFDSYLYARNTDTLALKESIRKLDIPQTAAVLIYGSGACAEAFTKKLISLGFSNISLMARNPIKAEKLRSKYNLQAPSALSYDLLINASPLGQCDTDDLDQLPKFRSLINLPLPMPHSYLEDKAINSGIPTINSTEFWHLQFYEQINVIGYPDAQILDTLS